MVRSAVRTTVILRCDKKRFFQAIVFKLLLRQETSGKRVGNRWEHSFCGHSGVILWSFCACELYKEGALMVFRGSGVVFSGR